MPSMVPSGTAALIAMLRRLNVSENRLIIAVAIQRQFRKFKLAGSFDCDGNVDAARQEACVTINPVPKRPVVSLALNSLLDPPDSSAATS